MPARMSAGGSTFMASSYASDVDGIQVKFGSSGVIWRAQAVQRSGYSREWIAQRAVGRRMSTSLVHGKVDRWLLEHEDWIAQGGATRLALCEDWGKVTLEFGAGHPAARGCLLALVREAWGDPFVYARKSSGRGSWVVWRKLRHDDERWISEGPTEADALAAALLAAPPTRIALFEVGS